MTRKTSTSLHKSKPREIERQVLPNGIRVVTERMPHVRSVSVGLWIGTGSREEELHQTGISHFVEHMVFKGTKHRTAEQIARSVDSIGGQNLWSQKLAASKPKSGRMPSPACSSPSS